MPIVTEQEILYNKLTSDLIQAASACVNAKITDQVLFGLCLGIVSHTGSK